jgi:outer membrane protein assembly factor BamB
MLDLQTASRLMVAAAAILLALAVVLRFGPPNVGPAPTPVPLDQLPSAGDVVARYSVEADDVPSAFGHGYIWLTNAATGELVRMDPDNGSIATPVQMSEPGAQVALALSDSSVWVADRRDSSVVELDPASLEERRRIPVDASVSAIAPDGTALWLMDRDAERLVRLETTDETIGSPVPIAGSAILVHGGWLWVSGGDGSLIRLDGSTGAEIGRVGIGMVADRLVASGNSILAVLAGEAIVRVDIGSMRVGSPGARVLAAISQDGLVWAVLPSGHVVRLDADSMQPVAASTVDLEPTGGLAIGGGWLWAAGLNAAGDASLLKFALVDD